MNRTNQYITLAVLIILPILIFLFLQGFGQNYYTLDIYHTKWLEEVEVEGEPYIDTVRDASKLKGKKIVDTLYHTISDFKLTDQNGESFTRKDLENKIHIADFIFTRCGNPTFCPRMSKQLQRVQKEFAAQEEVELVSYTIDPEYDTPTVLKAYAQDYNANPEKWHFLTGDKRKIYDLAFNAYKVSAMDEEKTITPDFLHSNKLVLVDKQGRIRGYYNGSDTEDVDKLIVETRVLLSEYQAS